jgi:hypothetical protein
VQRSPNSVSYQFYQGNNGKQVFLSYGDRQVVSTRNLLFTPLQLMQYQEGWAGIQITRNLNLVEAYPTHTLFLYQTPLVRFYAPLTPLLTANAQIDISAINQTGKPAVDYLAVHLQNTFKAIFSIYTLGSPTIRLEALYSYHLNGAASWSQIDLPIFLALPFSLNLATDLNIGNSPPYCPDATKSFICTVVSALLHWFKTVDPKKQHGQFTFKLIIFSASDNTTPLITMNNLSLAVGRIKELSGN